MAPEETAAATPQKSKKMLFIGLAVGFLVLAGINGVLVWKVVSNDSADAKTVEQEEVVVEDEDGFMYKLDPFIVNLFDDRGVRYLKVRLDIELAGECRQPFVLTQRRPNNTGFELCGSNVYEIVAILHCR